MDHGMSTEDRNRKKIERAALFVEKNLSKPLHATDIARHANLSSFHFQRLFCAYLGEPINQYITARRLEYAATRLANQPETHLLQLALECGFQTHSAFSRAFTSRFGVPPSTFRRIPERSKQGSDPGRPFLVTVRSDCNIDSPELLDRGPLHFQYRQSTGTFDGTFFSQNDRDVVEQFTDLFSASPAKGLLPIGCFPDTPQNLNDSTATIWFGGVHIEKLENSWSDNWYRFDRGMWAVFEHRSEHQFLYQTWNRIYRSWLPQSDLALRDEFPFEAYLSAPSQDKSALHLTKIFIPVRKA